MMRNGATGITLEQSEFPATRRRTKLAQLARASAINMLMTVVTAMANVVIAWLRPCVGCGGGHLDSVVGHGALGSPQVRVSAPQVNRQ
jgi:hypothetical protein